MECVWTCGVQQLVALTLRAQHASVPSRPVLLKSVFRSIIRPIRFFFIVLYKMNEKRPAVEAQGLEDFAGCAGGA